MAMDYPNSPVAGAPAEQAWNDEPVSADKPRTGVRFHAGHAATTVTVVVLLGAWWIASHRQWLPPVLLPTPEATLRKLAVLYTDGFDDATLSQHLFASVERIALAFVFALVTAIPAGIAIATNRIARGVLDPIIEFYRPVPPLAYLPLMVIWFGIGELSKVR